MIIIMEVPDDFHFLNIGLVDAKNQHAVTRSFTKCELIEKAEYIERSEFLDFPADVIDDTVPTGTLCAAGEMVQQMSEEEAAKTLDGIFGNGAAKYLNHEYSKTVEKLAEKLL